MRALLTGVLIVTVTGFSGGAVRAEEKKAAAKPVTDKERDAAIEKGMRYLGKTVFSLPDATGTPRKQFTVAVTGLVGILAGDAQSRTARRKNDFVDKARKYLDKYIAEVATRTADPSQLAPNSDGFSSEYAMQYTWPLGMSAVFYAELHARGMGKGAATKTLRRLVPVLEAAQAPNGGWGHAQVREKGKPRGPNEMDGYGGYPDTLLASTNIVTTGLALVKDVAPPKAENLFDRALAYYEYSELANGNFPYDPSQRSSHLALTGVSRAAGAVVAMRLLGVDWDDIGLSRALEYVDEHFAYLSEGHGSSAFNLMLAAVLQRMRGPRDWKRFKEAFFRRIVDKQQKDGSFLSICEKKAFGSTNDSERAGTGMFAKGTHSYVTAIHTLILLLDRTWPKSCPKPRPKSPDKVTTGD